MFNWTVMAITYFRFQRAMRVQNIDKQQYLHTKSRFLPYACYWALVWAPLFLFVQGYSVFLNGNWKVATFIFNYGIVSASLTDKCRVELMADCIGWRNRAGIQDLWQDSLPSF